MRCHTFESKPSTTVFGYFKRKLKRAFNVWHIWNKPRIIYIKEHRKWHFKGWDWPFNNLRLGDDDFATIYIFDVSSQNEPDETRLDQETQKVDFLDLDSIHNEVIRNYDGNETLSDEADPQASSRSLFHLQTLLHLLALFHLQTLFYQALRLYCSQNQWAYIQKST